MHKNQHDYVDDKHDNNKRDASKLLPHFFNQRHDQLCFVILKENRGHAIDDNKHSVITWFRFHDQNIDKHVTFLSLKLQIVIAILYIKCNQDSISA